MKNNKSKELMQKFSIFFVLLVLIIVSSVMNPNFLSHRNITNIAVQLAVATILAYGEMVLIVSGLLDLSSGAVLALSGVLSVSAYKATGSMAVAFAVSIGVAVIFNMINALFVANFALPAFIVTLATQMAARGLALLYTSGQNILQIGKYAVVGQGKIGPVPIPVIFTVLATIIISYIMNQTRLGRSFYAIGGNEEASIASGINVVKSKYMAFLINGVLVGIAGVLFMARVNAGLPNGRSDGCHCRRYKLLRRCRDNLRLLNRFLHHRLPEQHHEPAGRRLLHSAGSKGYHHRGSCSV